MVAMAWHITIEYREKLFRFGFFASFFSILVTACYLFYQAEAFAHSSFFSSSDTRYDFWIQFGKNAWILLSQDSTLFVLFIIFVVLVLLGWFFAPMICRASIAHLVSKIWMKEETGNGLPVALSRFFPLLEITAVKRIFDPFSFLTEFAFVARNLPGGLSFLAPFLFLLMALGILLLFFFTYTTQCIVIYKMNFVKAIKISSYTVFYNIRKTFTILVLFFLVELRVIINVLLILALPIVIIGTTGIFAGLFSQTIGIFFGAGILLVLLLLTAYVTGILFVFSEAILTIAFLELRKSSSPLSENT